MLHWSNLRQLRNARTPRTAIVTALLVASMAARAEPLTLEEALVAANQNNPDVRGSRILQEEAGVDVTTSYSPLLPQLNLQAQFTHYLFGASTAYATTIQGFNVDLGGASGAQTCLTTGMCSFQLVNMTYAQMAISTPSYDKPDYLLGLNLNWVLFDGFKSWAGISKAKALEAVAARAVDESWLTVGFETIRRFYELVRAQRTLAVLQETVVRSQDTVKRAQALFVAGRGPKSDVVAAQVNLGTDRVNVEQQVGRVEQASADLAFEIGRPPAQRIEVVPPPGIDASQSSGAGEIPPLEALIDQAKTVHPTLARFNSQIESADQDTKIAGSTWYPQLGLAGTYGREGPNLAGGDAVYGNPSRQYVAMGQVYINWNLFQGWSTRTAQQHADLALEKARLDADQALRQVADGINRARTQALTVSRSLAIAAETQTAAEEGVRLAKERFDVGSGTQLEIRDATVKLMQAKLTFINARIDYSIARADLNRAAGAVRAP